MVRSEKQRQERESNSKVKTHSRSEMHTIRLPVYTSSSFSCNSSRLVQTGLSGNCKSNSNGKCYYITWQKYTRAVMRAKHNAPSGLNKWKEHARKKIFWKRWKRVDVN